MQLRPNEFKEFIYTNVTGNNRNGEAYKNFYQLNAIKRG